MNVQNLRDQQQRLEEELSRVKEQLREAPLADLVSLIPEDIRPEAIVVWERGPTESTVLLRSPKMPKFAFVVWGKGRNSTRWSLTLNLGEGDPSRKFWVQCGCCPSEAYGLQQPEEEPAKQAWRDDMARQFAAEMASACKKHGIEIIFVRHAGPWQDRYGNMEGVHVYEANQCREVMGQEHGRKAIEEALEFLGAGTNFRE